VHTLLARLGPPAPVSCTSAQPHSTVCSAKAPAPSSARRCPVPICLNRDRHVTALLATSVEAWHAYIQTWPNSIKPTSPSILGSVGASRVVYDEAYCEESATKQARLGITSVMEIDESRSETVTQRPGPQEHLYQVGRSGQARMGGETCVYNRN